MFLPLITWWILPEEGKEKSKPLEKKDDLGDYTPIEKWKQMAGMRVKEKVGDERERRDSQG